MSLVCDSDIACVHTSLQRPLVVSVCTAALQLSFGELNVQKNKIINFQKIVIPPIGVWF